MFQTAVKKLSGNSKKLWKAYAEFEGYQTGNDMVERVQEVYSLALAETTKLTNADKCEIWVTYAEFMENYADNIADLRSVLKREQTWRSSMQIHRKRKLSASETTPVAPKQAKVEAPVASQNYAHYQQPSYPVQQQQHHQAYHQQSYGYGYYYPQ